MHVTPISQRTRRLAALLLLTGCSSAPPDGAAPDCRPAARTGCATAAGAAGTDPLVHLGRGESSTFIEITDLVVDDQLVFACTGVRGLAIWDASDDEPELLVEGVALAEHADSSFPRCQHVGLDRAADRVVITNRGDEIQPVAWLQALDVADPRQPKPIGEWVPGDGSIEGVVVDGARLFVARHTAGVTELRFGNGGLDVVGSFEDGQSDAWQPVLVGDTLVVAEGATGLRTYDVAGDDPQLLATLPIAGSSRDVVLDGDRAYVAASGSIAVVDLSDPAAPVLLGEVATFGTALAVAVAAPGTIVVAEWDELRGYDVSDPAAPTVVFSERVPTSGEFSRVLAVDADPARARVFGGEWEGLHQFGLREGSAAEISLNPLALQFGNIAAGDSEAAVLVVRNQGDRPLAVHDVAVPDAVKASETCFEVEPGGAYAIELSLAPTDGREFTGEVAVCSSDPDEPRAVVGLSANVDGLGVGDPLPTLALRDLSGRTWTNADLDGKVAVLAYFATF